MIEPSIIYSHFYAFFMTLFGTLTTGIFLNDYLLRIGFSAFDFGILYSLQYITGFIAYPVSFYANSIKRKKMFYLFFNFLSLGFFLVFVAAPYIPGAGTQTVIQISILSMGLFYIVSGIGRLVLIPWMFNVIGHDKWVKFFYFRNIIMYSVPIAATLIFGSLLKFTGIHILSGLFAFGLIMGSLAVGSMIFFPIPSYDQEAEPIREKPRAIVKQMKDTPGFLMMLAYTVLISFGVGLIAPIVFPYLISGIGIGSATVSIYQLIMMITSVGAVYLTSRICERKGSMTALILFSTFMWMVPIVLLLIPFSVTLLTGVLFMMGVADGYGIIFAGIMLTLINFSLAYTPEKNKIIYMATIDFIKALFMSTGSFLSGIIAGSVHFRMGSLLIDGNRFLFIFSFLILLSGLLAAHRLKRVLNHSSRGYERA